MMTAIWIVLIVSLTVLLGVWGYRVVQLEEESRYVLYEYHSPFAREIESLGWSELNMLEQ